MKRVRFMLDTEYADVAALYAACHPGWPARPPNFYHAHPTMVARIKGRMVGSTTFSVSWPPTEFARVNERVMYGHDVCVHPEMQGQGFGTQLHDARIRVAQEIGASLFIGFTSADNKPMLRIFEKQGLRLHAKLPGFYPFRKPSTEGLMYVGPVT